MGDGYGRKPELSADLWWDDILPTKRRGGTISIEVTDAGLDIMADRMRRGVVGIVELRQFGVPEDVIAEAVKRAFQAEKTDGA